MSVNVGMDSHLGVASRLAAQLDCPPTFSCFTLQANMAVSKDELAEGARKDRPRGSSARAGHCRSRNIVRRCAAAQSRSLDGFSPPQRAGGPARRAVVPAGPRWLYANSGG